MCVDLGLGGLVVGLPLNPMLAGSSLTDPHSDASPIARRCRSLANTAAILAAGRGVEVYLYDEASTSADARRLLGGSVSEAEQRGGFSTARDKKVSCAGMGIWDICFTRPALHDCILSPTLRCVVQMEWWNI